MIKNTIFYKVARYLYQYHHDILPSKRPKTKLSFENFLPILERLRIKRKDCLFVHHSFNNLNLSFNANQLIESLQEKVGEHGNIVMVATPYRGWSLDYLKSTTIFNVMKDHGMQGLISEIFRRKEGVYRSLHPLSSNYIWGKNAKQLSLQHKNFLYPYSEDSIYGYGNKKNAKVIGLGIDVHESITPLHYYESLKKEIYPFYTKEKYKINIKTSNSDFDINTYAPNPKITRNWKSIKRAINESKASEHFISSDRVFYAYEFKGIKEAIFKLMEKNKYFRSIQE